MSASPTTGQITENQIQEIEAAGFQVEPRRIVTEDVKELASGANETDQRCGGAEPGGAPRNLHQDVPGRGLKPLLAPVTPPAVD